jgi:hypothetical protein
MENKETNLSNKTNEELKQIAEDLNSGKLFIDRQIPEGLPVHMIIMPLIFMSKEQSETFKNNVESGEIAMIYEYIDKAGPRAINGNPMFMSLQTLSKNEVKIVFDYYNKIKKAIADL